MSARKLSNRLPAPLRPWARALGREGHRARLAVSDATLAVRNARGHAITHVSGPTTLALGPTELVVLCLVRNGEAHLPTFLRHYERLGARHLVFIDNGSTDGTLPLLTQRSDTTVFASRFPFSGYQIAFKRWMVRRFIARGGWALVADADELFDYPYSGTLPLGEFLAYLDARGYDAVTAHNLEMVPSQSIAALQGRDVADLGETHRYYDLSDIRQVRDQYWLTQNVLDVDGHFTHTGGVWETIFGYGGSKLTKQPLFRRSRGLHVFPYDVHFVTGARIADVTTVFRHYKYTGKFVAHVREELERRQYYGKAEIFEHYRRALDANPELTLYRPTAREWHRAEDLLDGGFLIASSHYHDWVARRGARGSAPIPIDAASLSPPTPHESPAPV